MSGLKLRLNEVKDKFGKLNQVIVIKLKAQWLSGLNLRLIDLLETYSTLRGWTDEAKIIRFSTSGLLPTVRGWTDKAKIIRFSTSGPLPTVRGWTDEAKIIRFSTSGLLPTLRGWADEAKII
ncbi:hypothetical protein [Globicatella sanguinis]